MLKAAFWISVIVIALPFATGGGNGMPDNYRPEPVELGEVTTMVRTTASDFMGLCDREPETCDTGQRILWNARVAAGNLAGRAQDWLSENSQSASRDNDDRDSRG